jgi:hypothetical protein
MQIPIPRQPFDGGDSPALRRDGKRQTRKNPPTIDLDRTGAALPVIAPLFRAS